MLGNVRSRNCAITLSVLIFLMVGFPVITVDSVDVPRDLNVGPYVDKVLFKMSTESSILGLLGNELDILRGPVGQKYAPDFDADPDISYSLSPRNGYGHITINCGKYPLNISGFRRAFAYAFDKTRVSTEIFNGFARDHDSLVPYTSPWCIEDDLPYHYYTARPDLGNAILDSLNFQIDPDTGFRTAPDGSAFSITLEHTVSFPELSDGVAIVAKEALAALHIDADSRAGSIWDILARIDMKLDYDMVFYAWNFPNYDVDWLAYEYWSELVDVNFQNPSRFENDTYDSWRDQLLHSTTYEDVYEASAAMQLILHENVPQLVVYSNMYLIPYRTDAFTGHVVDLTRYISGPWTLRNIRKIDGTFGGTFRISLGNNPETFNIFVDGNEHSEPILRELWPSLYMRAPDTSLWPYLAEGMTVETHEDNHQIPNGHTRFTIDIVQNATWSDGVPLTAEDVAFTYTYAFESFYHGNPFGVEIMELESAYAPTPYTAVIEYGTESWWHTSSFAELRIIPHHIFNTEGGLGYEDWNVWNPVFNPEDPHVTCGPYILTDWEFGEYYELTANSDFFYYPQERKLNSTTTTTETESPPPFNATLALTAGVVGAAAVIIVGSMGVLKLEK